MNAKRENICWSFPVLYQFSVVWRYHNALPAGPAAISICRSRPCWWDHAFKMEIIESRTVLENNRCSFDVLMLFLTTRITEIRIKLARLCCHQSPFRWPTVVHRIFAEYFHLQRRSELFAVMIQVRRFSPWEYQKMTTPVPLLLNLHRRCTLLVLKV